MPRYELVRAATSKTAINPFTAQRFTTHTAAVARFVEIEREGRTLRTATGDIDGLPRLRSHEHVDEGAATVAEWRRLRKIQRRGFVLVSASRELAGLPVRAPGSILLAESYFVMSDGRFLGELLAVASYGPLAAFAERWFRDPRPFARRELLAYVGDGCDRAGHKGLVKRIFKLAEAAGDDELVGHFLVSFDQLTKRALLPLRRRFIWRTRRAEGVRPVLRDPSTIVGRKDAETSARFSYRTRGYLARRAWRYFRKLGFRDLARYGDAVRAALALYPDAAFATPLSLLAAWGAMHAMYKRAGMLRSDGRWLYVGDGKRLADLTPAPEHPAAWTDATAIADTLTVARSRTVRRFLVDVFRALPASSTDLPIGSLFPLLMSGTEEGEALGIELFQRARLENVTLSDWRSLLAHESIEVAAVVTLAVEKYVAPSRLTLLDCLDWTASRLAPVAELGLRALREKAAPTDVASFARAARSPVAHVREEAAGIVAARLDPLDPASIVAVRDLVDAAFPEVRRAGLRLIERERAFAEDPAIVLALAESPYADARGVLLVRPAVAASEARRHVFATTAFSVRGGSREKRRVGRQIAEEARAAGVPTADAIALLSLLSPLVRSVRPAERDAALGALARAVSHSDEARSAAKRLFPELSFDPEVTE